MGKPGGRQQILLSTILRQVPQLFSAHKVSVVSRYITHLDLLPAQYQGAQVVLLSRNSLASLQGIQQFVAAKTVSLAANLLESFDDLAPLIGGCPALEALSLEGNPLSALPNYRAHVLTLLPSIKSLDGKAVSPEERTLASMVVEREQALLAVLLTSACAVHKMARVLQQVQLHMELGQVMHGALQQPPQRTSVDPQKLLSVWDYEAGLTPQERSMIEGALRREVMREHRRRRGEGGSPTWDSAFSQVLLSQQQTLARLLELLQRAKHAAARALQQQGPAIAALHSDEEMQKRAGQDDRERLVQGLRDAYQQLSPGGRVASPAPNSPHARSPQALCNSMQHTLYHITKAAKPTNPIRVKPGKPQDSHVLAPGSAKPGLPDSASDAQVNGGGSPRNSRRGMVASASAQHSFGVPIIRKVVDAESDVDMAGSISVRSSGQASSRAGVFSTKTPQPGSAKSSQTARRVNKVLGSPPSRHGGRLVDTPQYAAGAGVSSFGAGFLQPATQVADNSSHNAAAREHQPRRDAQPRPLQQQEAQGYQAASAAEAGREQQQARNEAEQYSHGWLLGQEALEQQQRRHVHDTRHALQQLKQHRQQQQQQQQQSSYHGIGQPGRQEAQQQQREALLGTYALRTSHDGHLLVSTAKAHGDPSPCYLSLSLDSQAFQKTRTLHPNLQLASKPVDYASDQSQGGQMLSLGRDQGGEFCAGHVTSSCSTGAHEHSGAARSLFALGTQAAPAPQHSQARLQLDSHSAAYRDPLAAAAVAGPCGTGAGDGYAPHGSSTTVFGPVAGSTVANSGRISDVSTMPPAGLRTDQSFSGWNHLQHDQYDSQLGSAQHGSCQHAPQDSLGNQQQQQHLHSVDAAHWQGLRSTSVSMQPQQGHGDSLAEVHEQLQGAGCSDLGWQGNENKNALHQPLWQEQHQHQQQQQGHGGEWGRSAQTQGFGTAQQQCAMAKSYPAPVVPEICRAHAVAAASLQPSSVHHAPARDHTTPGRGQDVQGVSPLGRLQQEAQHHLQALQEQLQDPLTKSPARQHMTPTAMSTPVTQQPSPAMSPPKELESKLTVMTMGQAALEQALIQEQDEAWSLRQELEEQRRQVDDLAACLEESQQQVEDVQLAAGRETEELCQALASCMEERDYAHAQQQQEHATLVARLEEEHRLAAARQQAQHEQAMALQADTHQQELERERQLAAQQVDEQRQQLQVLQLEYQREVAERQRSTDQAARAAEDSQAAQQALAALHQQQQAELLQQMEGREARHRKDAAQLQDALADKAAALLEAQAQAAQLMDSLLCQQEAQAGLEDELQAVKQLYDELLAAQVREQGQKELAQALALKALLRRSWFMLRQAVVISQQQGAELQAAERLCAWHAKQAVVRRWKHAVLLAKACRGVRIRVNLTLLRQALVAWQVYGGLRRWKAVGNACAEQHNQMRLRLRAFSAWLQWLQQLKSAIQDQVPFALLSAAMQLHCTALQRRALSSWLDYHAASRVPKIKAKRRAERLRARTLLVQAWRSWATFIPQSQQKRARNAWIMHRRKATLLQACWSAWLHRAGRAQAVRVAAVLASRRHASHLLKTWHAEAKCRARQRQGITQLAATQRQRYLRGALHSWLQHVHGRRQKLQRLQLAASHRCQQQLRVAFWSWHHHMLCSVQQLQQAHGMQVHQRALQATLRWYCLSQALQRQQLQQHWAQQRHRNAQAAAQRAILHAWFDLVAGKQAEARASRQSAAVAFCDAYVVQQCYKLLSVTFRAWSRLGASSARQAASRGAAEAALQLQHCQQLLDQCRADAAAAAEHSDQRLLQAAERLRELQAEQQALQARAEGCEGKLGSSLRRCSELEGQLEVAKARQEALTGELGGALSDASALAAEREQLNKLLQQERDELTAQLTAAEGALVAARHEEATLRSEQGSLQLQLAQAQQGLRDLSLQMTQKVAWYERQQADLQEALSLAQRELEAKSGVSRRSEQQATELKAELRSVREAHDHLLSKMRRDLRTKDEQLQFLQHHLQLLGEAAVAPQPSHPLHHQHQDEQVLPGLIVTTDAAAASSSDATAKALAAPVGPASADRGRDSSKLRASPGSETGPVAVGLQAMPLQQPNLSDLILMQDQLGNRRQASSHVETFGSLLEQQQPWKLWQPDPVQRLTANHHQPGTGDLSELSSWKLALAEASKALRPAPHIT